MRMNTNIPMMGQGVNALGAIDAGNQARFRVNQEQHANALRPLEVQSAQLGIKQQGLNLDLTQQRITDIRRQAAEAARATENKAALAQEYQQAQNGMKMALTAFTTGDERAWQRVTQEFGMPGLPMDERGAAALDAVLSGIGEGLGMPIPQPQQPLSPQGKLMADLQAGRITQEQFDAAGKPNPLLSLDMGGNGVQVVDPKRGIVAIPDPAAPSGVRYENVPGGEADREAQAAQGKTEMREGMAATAGDVVVTAAQRAREAAKGRLVSGAAGAIAAYNPGSQNAEVYRQVSTLQAMAAAENINAMRQASPTGGALGNASDADILLLKQKSGALDPASPNFERDLADYERTLLETIHGREAGRRIFEETRAVRPTENAATPPGRGAVPIQPPRAAIGLLQQDPSPEARREFDEAFGEGAAARALGQ